MAFSAGSIPTAMLTLMTGTYLPRFYAGHVGVGLAVLGLTIATIRLADVGLDIFLGWAMDKTETRLGRFKPWYAAALPFIAFAAFKLFNPPADAGIPYLVTWLLVLYAGYSMAALSHAAWGASLATDYHERSRIFGWMQAVAVTGSVALLLAPVLTHGKIRPGAADSMDEVAIIAIVLMALMFPITLIFAPERMVRSKKKDRTSLKDLAAVITTPSMARLVIADLVLTLGPGTTAPMYIFFFADAKGFSIEQVSLLLIPYIGAGLIGAPTWATVARKLGKHRTVQVAAVCYAICQTTLMAIPKGMFLETFLGMFAVGFSVSAFALMIRAMVADVSDQVRLETGKERSAILYSLIILTSKVGSSLTASIVLPILAAVGYNAKEGAVNTPEAIFGLEMCYLFAPIILVVVGATLFWGYKLNETKHAEIRAALEEQERLSVAASEEAFLGPGEAAPAPAQ